MGKSYLRILDEEPVVYNQQKQKYRKPKQKNEKTVDTALIQETKKPVVFVSAIKDPNVLYQEVLKHLETPDQKGARKEFKSRVYKAHFQGITYEKVYNIALKYVYLN